MADQRKDRQGAFSGESSNRVPRGDPARRRDGDSRGKRDRTGKPGRDRKGPPGARGREEGGGRAQASYRVLQALSVLEKGMTKADFGAQKAPLQEIARALRPLRLKSIDELDFNTRGRLLTSLLRVGRQSKPASPPPAEEALPPEIAPEAAAPEASPSEGAPQVAPLPPSEAALKVEAYAEAMYQLGCVWRALSDDPRATQAFTQSGRSEAPPEVEEAPSRPQRKETPKRLPRWEEAARALEEKGRTRDAARLHEKNKSFAQAMRLFELGNEGRSALRCAMSAKDSEAVKRLASSLKPQEVQAEFEKAGAWEELMQIFVEAGNFEGVARLYERSRQFDQAALAWERAEKWSMARKAYEKARDDKGAARVREWEAKRLLDKGDRLGAATLYLAAREKDRAVEALMPLPGPKAFRFLQQLKLEEEARALAQREIEKAQQENRPQGRARWLELLGEFVPAAEAWLSSGRSDKAVGCWEAAGQWQKAAELAQSLGQYEKAAELYGRAGDPEAAQKMQEAARTQPAPPVMPAAEADADAQDAPSEGRLE